jgi:hypothetical protein
MAAGGLVRLLLAAGLCFLLQGVPGVRWKAKARAAGLWNLWVAAGGLIRFVGAECGDEYEWKKRANKAADLCWVVEHVDLYMASAS